MRKDWHGLLKVLEIKHIGVDGNTLWEQKNLLNTFHTDGEQFMLQALFTTLTEIPEEYYLGLDNRLLITVDDTMEEIEDEPNVHGYIRQSLGIESDGWTVEKISGVYRAIGNIITFNATGGSWGPVSNLFLTDQSNNSGFLLASVALSDSISVANGEAISMRMALQLQDDS